MNLLLAIDDSPASELAVRAVATRPWPSDTRVRVLSVTGVHPGAPLPDPAQAASVPEPAAGPPSTHPAMNDALRIAQRGIDALLASGLNSRIRVREGTPGSGIVEEACEWPADLIVMGSRGLGAVKRLVLGSVAHYVLEHAPCSVEIVRAREEVL